MAIPGTVGKARRREQRRFSLAEGEIQQNEIAVWSGLKSMNALGGGGEARRGGFSGGEVERGEVSQFRLVLGPASAALRFAASM